MFLKKNTAAFVSACLLTISSMISRGQTMDIPGTNDARLLVPAVTGALTIDGKTGDPAWSGALTLPLSNPENESLSKGGETRIAVRGKYLCLSSTIPETDRLLAHSTGNTPKMWYEDMVIWRIYSMSPLTKRNTALSLVINPFGAFSLLEAENYYTAGRNDPFTTTDQPVKWSADILVAATINQKEWITEAALPLEQLGPIGFILIERIRPFRPESPELRWYWPQKHVSETYRFPEANAEPKPLFDPQPLPENKALSISGPPVSPLAREVSGLPKNVWSEKERDSLQISSRIERSVQADIAEGMKQEQLAWQKVRTLADWEHFRNKRLDAFRNWIGPLPDRTPLRSTITGTRNYGDGFVIENILYESRPHLTVTANLYLPEKPSASIPAIVIVHSLHFPKTQIELQEMGMVWARSGAAVLVLDLLCAGERIQSQPWRRESYFGRYALGNQLYLAGESLIKWMAWDIVRGIDLLAERKYIDQKRIVLIGAVAGGGDPATVAAILDNRVSVVIPFNFGKSGSRKPIDGNDTAAANPGSAYWETTRNIPGSISEQFFPWFLCASMAPRNFLYASESKWSHSVEEEIAWARYKKIYSFYKSPDRLAEVHGYTSFPGPGECNNVGIYHRKQIDPILSKWIGLQVDQPEFRRQLPESDLICFTPKMHKTFASWPAVAVAREIAGRRLDDVRKDRTNLSKTEQVKKLRADLATKLGDIEPTRKKRIQKRWEKRSDRFILEALTIETDQGIVLPVFLLSPSSKTSGKAPCVVALAEGGKKKFLTFRYNEIAALLEKGIMVCLPDLRGNGELISDTSRAPDAMDLAANELLFGRTLTGGRVKDTRTILRWLSGDRRIDPERIALWGDSFSDANSPDFNFEQSPDQRPGPVTQRLAEPMGSFISMLTMLFEDRVAASAGNGGLVSFSSSLDNRFCQLPQDVIVPGLLQVADIGDITTAIAPRPIYLENLVDGLNKNASSAAIDKQYTSGTEVNAHNSADRHELINWMSQRLLTKK